MVTTILVVVVVAVVVEVSCRIIFLSTCNECRSSKSIVSAVVIHPEQAKQSAKRAVTNEEVGAGAGSGETLLGTWLGTLLDEL